MTAWPEGIPPKAELREQLRASHRWLDDDRFGPRNVDAGDCDRCGAEPRLVTTCGPEGGQYGRRCARETDWCDGHADEAVAALAWLQHLPDDADEIAYLWWLATGEVRAGVALANPEAHRPPITRGDLQSSGARGRPAQNAGRRYPPLK